jgi:cytoskeletal protein RodZ
MNRLRFSIVVLAVGLAVAGCGGGDSGPTSTKATGPAETVKGTTTTEAPASTETGKGTTSTTTTAADVPATGGPPADDAYIGTVSVPGEYAEMAEVLDSRVEVRITDGTAKHDDRLHLRSGLGWR